MKLDARHKITILARQARFDDEGAPVNTWAPVLGLNDLWASKEPLLGNEFFAAEQTQSKVEVKFRSRWIPGVKNEMRVRDSEGDYDILSAINVKGLNRELLMYCKKVV